LDLNLGASGKTFDEWEAARDGNRTNKGSLGRKTRAAVIVNGDAIAQSSRDRWRSGFDPAGKVFWRRSWWDGPCRVRATPSTSWRGPY